MELQLDQGKGAVRVYLEHQQDQGGRVRSAGGNVAAVSAFGHVPVSDHYSCVTAEEQLSSLDGFWPTLTEAQHDGIEASVMDMWDPYVASTKQSICRRPRASRFDNVKRTHPLVNGL